MTVDPVTGEILGGDRIAPQAPEIDLSPEVSDISPEMKASIEETLNNLFEFQCQREAMRLKKQQMIDSVMPQDVKDIITDINAEFSADEIAVDENIKAMDELVRELALKAGGSVKGEHLHAVVSPDGRRSAKVGNLEKAARALKKLPELKGKTELILKLQAIILGCIEDGAPSVTIRVVK